MKKVVFYLCLFIILIVAGVGLWAYFAFLYTKPLNKAEIAELTPDWSIVTHGDWSPWVTEDDGSQTWNPVASFNAWLATVPEEDKAWPVLVDVQYAGYELYDNLELGKFPDDVEDWQSMVAMCELDESKEMIDRLKNALQRPVMGAVLYESSNPEPVGRNNETLYTRDPVEFAAMEKHGVKNTKFIESTNTNINLISVGLPALGKQRLISNLFRTYGIYELEQVHGDEFVELMTISMDSANIVPALNTMIGQLVAIAIERDGMKTIAWGLEHHPEQFADEHLRQLDELIARHQNRTFIWQGEAMSFHDSIRRMVNDRGALDAFRARSMQGGGASFDLPSNIPDDYLPASTQRTLYVYNTIMKQAHDESADPLAPKGPRLQQSLAQAKKDLNAIGYLVLDMMTPSMNRIIQLFQDLPNDANTLRLTIAAHRHALRHGEIPASNADIDEDLLPD